MSDAMLGADYASLQSLIEEYRAQGLALQGEADLLQQQLSQAVTNFRESSRQLRDQVVRARADYMSGPIASISQQAAAVVWTGANRGAFDTSFATLKNNVQASLDTLDSGLTTLVNAIESGLNASLTDAANKATTMGQAMNADATTFKADVETQMANLRAAADTGWA
jgi:hypothetical protein